MGVNNKAYILHENCIKGKKYYFKARVNSTSGKNSPWTVWTGKIAGDTVLPTVIETSHISSVSNPQQQVSYYINSTYSTPGDFEVFRWYAVRRAEWISPYTWQDSYADNYYEGTRNHTFTLKAERQYPIVWDIFVGVMDVAGNINIPTTPQLVGVVPTTQINLQDYSHDVKVSSADSNTVSWSAGTLMLGNNERYNIAANNSGNMLAQTYIYLDTDVSVTELQTTITASGATGPTKKLIAVAKDSTNEAIFQTFGGIGGLKVRSEHIEAYSISGVNISAATTITAGTGNNVGVIDGADALWRLYAGHATPASAPFRVDQAGQMYATGATITGNITATSGIFGGWTIGEAKLTSSGGGVALDAHDNSIWLNSEAFNTASKGVQIQYNGGTPRMHVGDGTGDKYFMFDGSDFSFKGTSAQLTPGGTMTLTDINASGGIVGGWTLAANSLTGGANDHIKAGQTDFGVGTGFYLGHDGADYKFSIGSTSRNLEWDGVTLTVGGVVLTGLRTGSEPSIQGWSHDLTLSATDADTVAWSSGTITLTNGDTYSIDAGNTGNMSAINYIYLDNDTSVTVLQVTTTAATAVGSGKILLAVAENNSGSDATFQTFGGEGGALWKANNIAANTITANEIAANIITAAEITADTITADEMAANSITAVEIAASTILASNIRAGTISGQNIAANARIVAGTGDNVAVLDGADDQWRIYAGHNQASFAPFKVRQDGAAWMTNATLQTSSGTGQRLVISSADNTLKFYNPAEELAINIDDDIAGSGQPGIDFPLDTGGVITMGNGSTDTCTLRTNWLFIHSTINTVPTIHGRNESVAIGGAQGVVGQFSSEDLANTGDKRVGVFGTSLVYHANSTDPAVGVYAHGWSNGDAPAYGIWAHVDADGGGIGWAGYFEGGNVNIENKLFVGNKLVLSGAFETSAGMTISGQAGEDPGLIIKSYSTAEGDRPTITMQHERSAGGTSTNTIQMHEYALKINCDEQFFLTANGNNTMVVHGSNDVEFYQDVTISGATQLAGRGAAVDCITVTDKGVLTMNGKARVMISVDIEPGATRLPSANAPAEDNIDEFPMHRYDRGTEESVKIHWEIPHGYATAGVIHIHYEFMTDAQPGGGDEDVVLGVEYKKISNGDVFDFSAGTTSATTTETIGEFETPFIKRMSGEIILTTTGWAVADTILLRFFRDATNVNDTYDSEGTIANNDVWVFNYHVEYEIDQHGEPVT